MLTAVAFALFGSALALGETHAPEAVYSINKEPIRRVILERLWEVRNCYEAGLARDPALRGRVVLRFVIADTGAVESSSIASSDLADPGVGECIAEAALGWRFPRFPDAARITVSYPFTFAPEAT